MKAFVVASFVAVVSVLQVRRALGKDVLSLRGGNQHQGSPDTNTTTTTTFLSLPLISHAERFPNASIHKHHVDNQRRWRRRHLSSSSLSTDFTQINPLYQGYGTHYVDLWVGTPIPQRQTLIVDTGSAVTAFPCEHCSHGCGTDGHHIDSYYRESDSRTFRVVECSRCKIGSCSRHHHDACITTANYQEGSSWKAFEASDVVYSGGPHESVLKKNKNSFRMHFACQTKLTGFFKTQMADGIMGMEMASSSMWKQMYTQGVLQEKSFALCLSQQSSVSRSGTLAGSMTLGGVDTRLHTTNMVYANQLNTRGWFVVRLKRLFLRTRGGEFAEVPHAEEPHESYMQVDVSEEDLNNGNIVLDSGTTDTYLSQQLYHDFNKAWKSLMDERPYNNENRRYTTQELLSLPTILFQLEAYDKDDGDAHTPGLVGNLDKDRPTDVLVAMPPTHYMEYNPTTKRYASRLYFNEKKGGVLGANFMMGHDVYFDAHRGRIGFAESTCEYNQNESV